MQKYYAYQMPCHSSMYSPKPTIRNRMIPHLGLELSLIHISGIGRCVIDIHCSVLVCNPPIREEHIGDITYSFLIYRSY